MGFDTQLTKSERHTPALQGWVQSSKDLTEMSVLDVNKRSSLEDSKDVSQIIPLRVTDAIHGLHRHSSPTNSHIPTGLPGLDVHGVGGTQGCYLVAVNDAI